MRLMPSTINFISLRKNKAAILLVLASCFILNYASVFGQELTYARSVVDTLGSSSMHGRGYVSNGDRLAAEYIASEFSRLKLQSYTDSFVQPFDVSVNTFPGAMTLGLNDQPMIPGVDFLVSPGCPTTLGSFDVVYLTVKDVLDGAKLFSKLGKAEGKFIIVDVDESTELSKEKKKAFDNNLNVVKYAFEIPIAGIVLLTSQKLTWSVSGVQEKRAIITVRKQAAPNKIKTIVVDVEAQWQPSYTTQNVLGYIPGQKVQDSLVVVTAHYDHLGRMGERTYFPGANDNASGIAMLLSFAEYFSKPENRPDYTLVLMAFGGEELGLKGSEFFVQNPTFKLNRVKFLLNFDIAGTGDDGIQVVNGSVFKPQFERLQNINDQMNALKEVKIRGEACNSDHCLFYKKGVPSFFIYTLGGIQAYHDVFDKPETLPLTKYESYFRLMTEWIKGL